MATPAPPAASAPPPPVLTMLTLHPCIAATPNAKASLCPSSDSCKPAKVASSLLSPSTWFTRPLLAYLLGHWVR